MGVIERLREEGFEYSPLALKHPVYDFDVATRSGNFIFVSGHVSSGENGVGDYKGKVGGEVTSEEARKACRLATFNCLRAVGALGIDLEYITQVLRLNVWINAVPSFTAYPPIANAGSTLLLSVFGEKGRHARAAMAPGLPHDFTCEVEMILEVRG